MSDADALLQKLIDDPSGPEAGVDANGLLRALFRGYPIAALVRLLRGPHVEHVKLGAWLLSELGERGRVLVDELPMLLRHESSSVRAYALDSVLTCCSPSEGQTVAEALTLLDDPHVGVRYKAADLLIRAQPDQLQAAVSVMKAYPKRFLSFGGLEWLLGDEAQDADRVADLLATGSAVDRKFALAAVIRRHGGNASLRERVLTSTDVEVAELGRRASL